jgi:cell division protein FtsI/penicillin-binding protein 2
VNDSFWGELAPEWRTRLSPSLATLSLNDKINDTDWANTLSLGETNMMVTGLHISRFLQAVGNDGVILRPVARSEHTTTQNKRDNGARRVISTATARRLQAAMKDAVQRGTGREVASTLQRTGWQIGGKTGTGPNQIGPQSDGWFAGLIFDPKGKARFTVATFVRHGGRGGGNAARISAQLALFLIGSD